MAKKIRPNTLMPEQPVEAKRDLDAPVQTVPDESQDPAQSLDSANSALVAENADLKSKIEDYLKDIDDLKAQLKNASGKSSDVKTASLELKIEALKEEKDKLLVRISDLTFENAKLGAQIQELKKQLTMPRAPEVMPAPELPINPQDMQNEAPTWTPKEIPLPKFEIPRTNYANNGYGTW